MFQKVTAVRHESKEVGVKYPYFGIKDDGLIVLFTGKSTGTVIVKSPYWGIGNNNSEWAEEQFSPFYGTIIIEKV